MNHCAAAACIALGLLTVGAQAQGLRSPAQPAPAQKAISRALDATTDPVALESRGLRSADFIVAVVNSEPVTNNEVRARMQRVVRSISEQGGQLPPEPVLAREVLERLIVEKIQLQDAKDSGIRVDDFAVEQALLNVARQNDISKSALLGQLRAEGLSEAGFREELRNQMTMQRLRERDVDNRVRVTEPDIDQYVREQRRGADTSAAVAMNLAHVLVSVPENASAEVVAEREARATQAAQAARSQADFAAVVQEYSDAPDGQGGGPLGMRALDRYPELFAKAAAAAPVGAVLGPLRSGAGFHVLKVVEKSQAGVSAVVTQNHARHILLRMDGQTTEAEAAARLADYRRRVVNGQASFEALAREHSQDGSAKQGGDLGWASPGQFVPEFERTLNALQPGEISEPLVSRFGVHLIQLVERRQATLSPREQRDMLRSVVRERKLETDYAAWLQELRGRAYVEYRDPPQ